MEFAVVNNFMGPIATKVMKGYSDEDLTDIDDFKVSFKKYILDLLAFFSYRMEIIVHQ